MLKIREDPQGFRSTFDTVTGFAVRGELADGTDPIYASTPELVDCKITEVCDNGCSYCYMDSSLDGHHCYLADYGMLLSQWAKMGVQQVALGGGEPTMHPLFESIVKLTRAAGIVPNYSTNGRHLPDSILDVSRDFCGAVAVSWHDPPNALAVTRLIDHGVKTNIHFILSGQTVDDALILMRRLADGFLGGLNALIFLRLKPVGRASGQDVNFTSPGLEVFFRDTECSHPYKIGFDACLIPLVMEHTSFDPMYFDYCDGGRFSCYIDAVRMEMKKCSFDLQPGYPLATMSVQDAWDDMISQVSVKECELDLFGERGRR